MSELIIGDKTFRVNMQKHQNTVVTPQKVSSGQLVVVSMLESEKLEGETRHVVCRCEDDQLHVVCSMSSYKLSSLPSVFEHAGKQLIIFKFSGGGSQYSYFDATTLQSELLWNSHFIADFKQIGPLCFVRTENEVFTIFIASQKRASMRLPQKSASAGQRTRFEIGIQKLTQRSALFAEMIAALRRRFEDAEDDLAFAHKVGLSEGALRGLEQHHSKIAAFMQARNAADAVFSCRQCAEQPRPCAGCAKLAEKTTSLADIAHMRCGVIDEQGNCCFGYNNWMQKVLGCLCGFMCDFHIFRSKFNKKCANCGVGPVVVVPL